MRKLLGWLFLLAGAWMMLSPQAVLGLEQLRWMASFAFPGEILLGVLAISIAYYFLDFKVKLGGSPPEE